MPDETSEAQEPQAGKKKMPLMTIIVVAVIMIAEAAVFGGVWFMAKPESAQAQEQAEDPDAALEELVEVALIGDKFQNTRQGAQSYLYDATIYVVVKRKNEGFVQAQIESNTARISADIRNIFERAEPAHLNEPEKLTIKRQITERCQARFGEDAEGDPYVVDVVISNWKRFSADF